MKQRFTARLESVGPSGAWTILTLPFDSQKVFGVRGRLSVKGKINRYLFRSSIFPDGKGCHTLMVNKAMQLGARATPGDKVVIEIEPDTSTRVVTVPSDLKRMLARNKMAGEFFAGLAPSYQKAYVDWLESARTDDTRGRRLEKTVELLSAGKKQLK